MPLFQLAEQLGIRVRWRRHMADAGRWYPHSRKIALNLSLEQKEVPSVLGHELGHAVHGHECRDDEAHEAQADAWAANFLLDADAIARCARIWPENPEYWCDELNVTPDILRAWMRDPTNYQAAERRLAA